MSFATCNDAPITVGEIRFRAQGAWTAVLQVATDDPSSVTGSVEIDIAGSTLKGTALLGGEDLGSVVSVRVVGGAGGLSETAPKRGYGQPAPRRQLFNDLLGPAGERLSSTIEASVLDPTVPQWVRIESSVGDALWRLTEDAGQSWRVLGDGTIWIGSESWDEVEGREDLTIEDEGPEEGTLVVVGIEALVVLPGMAWDGKHITEVVYSVDSTTARAAVRFGAARGGLEETLGPIVQSETAHLEYYGSWLARAVGQNGDGTLELQPYSERWPGLSAVRMRHGIPGVTVAQITPGIDVVFTFEDGRPRAPIVTSFATSEQALKLVIAALDLRLGADESAQGVAIGPIQKICNDLIAAHTHEVVGTTAGPSASLAAMPDPTSQTVKATS